MRILRLVFLAVVSLTATGELPAQTSAVPDLILHNGHIFTGDPNQFWVEALSIRGDRILAAGTNAAIRASASPHTRLIDLHGRMAMPGINDAHDHAGGGPFGVEAHTATPPTNDPPLPEIRQAIQTAVATAPAGAWIHATVGLNAIKHPAEFKAAMDMDGAGHPVILIAWWGHGVVLNSQALAALHLDDNVKDPPGGHYDRDSQGHLTGLAEEYAGAWIKRRLSMQNGVPATIAPLRQYAQQRLREGVTSVQLMSTEQPLSTFPATLRQANIPLRVRVMRYRLPDEDERANEIYVPGEQIISSRARISGVKYVLDGTPMEQLAWSLTDYPGRPGWRGRPNFPPDFIEAQLRQALLGKDQLILHITGDAMADEVLGLMEKLAPPERWRPLRVRFEHANPLDDPARVARAHQLGIVIAQPRPTLAFRATLQAGIPLAYGSDQGMAPFFIFARMTDPKNPNAITREQALTALTATPAYAEFEEKEKGTLAPGMFADIAVLSKDVTTAPNEALPATKSVLTIIGGKIEYESTEGVE
jgi:predicted amidohydrolase YtcJ